MINLQIRIDDKLKEDAQKVANDMGMDLTTAVRIFLKQMVTDRAMPFRPDLDPFYSAKNQEMLKASIAQIETGKAVTKTLSELEDMEK